MSHRKIMLLTCLGLCLAWTAHGFFNLPPQPSPEKFGNILMDRVATAEGEKAVVFSHWSHRTRFSCRVCHLELGFAMAAGQSGVTEERNLAGQFCGTCHDGSRAFGHTREHCTKCHTGPEVDRSELFAKLVDPLPKRQFGNGVDWSLAVSRGLIAPRYSLYSDQQVAMGFKKRLELAAEWNWVPPAIFDHVTHAPWLDCANCHPEPFNIKKKTTKHFRMEFILEKQFCGACHFSVALPIDDCRACHPDMKAIR